MLSFAYYLLKVSVCSGLLFGYYFFALRNKRFHQYNRFYLIAAVLLAWIVPVLRIEFWNEQADSELTPIKLITVVASGDAFIEESLRRSHNFWDWEQVSLIAFIIVSAGFLLWLIAGIIRIAFLIKANPKQSWNNIHFVFTNVKGTPFSFFKYIFWNKNIDLHEKEGQHILQHELTHVNEKHSADKLLLNGVLIIGWINPFFWLIRKELNMIHEFIADKKAISDGDTTAFAAMLLKSAFPQHSFALTNSFFHSPIKRRLTMLTTSNKTSYSYIRRLMILPLLCFVVVFFAFKAKNKDVNNFETKLDRTYTVIIDAGHGGQDNGAIGTDGTKEKDITLELAKAVKELNSNSNINILLSRKGDETLSPQQRLDLVQKDRPDAFISLHINNVSAEAAAKDAGGVEISIPNRTSPFIEQSKAMVSVLSANMETVFKQKPLIKQREQKIWVLDENKTCPSLLVECGYLNNRNDMALLNSEASRKLIANAVLKTINQYFASQRKETASILIGPAAEKSESAAELSESLAAKAAIKIQKTGFSENNHEKEAGNTVHISISERDTLLTVKPLVILDGVEMKWSEFEKKQINPDAIQSINVLKGESTAKYGEKGKNGVIIITTKSKAAESAVTDQNEASNGGSFDKVFTRVENPPYYAKGMSAFAGYIESHLQYPAEAITNKVEGAVDIQFIVDEDGKLSQFKKLSSKGYGLEEEAIRLLKNSGEWMPGIQNGHKVLVQVVQQVIFKLPGKSTTSLNKEGNQRKLAWPVDNAKVDIHYGSYTIPGTSMKGRSDGIYISSTTASKVKAASYGRVSSVFELGDEKAVTIDHGEYFTTYSNLNSVTVAKDDVVNTGTILGQVAANREGKPEVFFMVVDKKSKFLDPEELLVAK